MPPLYTKDRNVSCGLGRNVEPLAILLPLFSLCKAEIAADLRTGNFDFHVIAWNKPSEIEMHSLTGDYRG